MRTALASNHQVTLLTPINPFLKIGLSFVLILLALLLENLTAMGVLVGGLLLLLTQLKVRPWMWLYSAFTLGLFALSAAWLLESWSEAFLSTLRILAILLPGPVLALTTPPPDLIRALQGVRLPSFLTLSLMLLWRFVPLMTQEFERIWEANLLRGVDLRYRPTQWFSGLIVPLVFQMVTYADDVTIGLQTRGYDPTAPRSTSQPLRWRWHDSLFLLSTGVWLGLIAYLEMRIQ